MNNKHVFKDNNDWQHFKNKYISITIPAYNEEGNISKAVLDAIKVLSSITDKYEVLVVDDGSTDKTAKILKDLSKKNKHIRIITFKKNKGVGEALNTIYKNVQGDYFLIVAGDNQVHMIELYKMLPYAMHNDIVVGYRMNRADGKIRKLSSSIFSSILRIRFGIPVKDIDSCKVYKTAVFKTIKPKSKTAFIETEILVKAKKSGLKIIEVPIKHHPRTSGQAKGVKLKIVIPQLLQMFKAMFGKF